VKPLFLGALKSAISSACGLIIALPIADPLTFSLKSLGGWEHIIEVLFVVVIVAEARYWKQWADSTGITSAS
jgi:hypothetical protein